jgi:hypothetical protein
MPRHLTLIALALVVFACANEAEKPVETPDTPATATAVDSTSSDTDAGSLSHDNSLRIREREILDSIHMELYNVVYPVDTIPDYTGIGGEGSIITWWPDNIHLIPRKDDTLVLATFERDYNSDSHADPAYMDLVAASLRNGKLRIIDRRNNIPLGEWGNLPSVGDFRINPAITTIDAGASVETGFRRFGRNTWGWVLSSPWSGQGFSTDHTSIYALMNNKIQDLGGFLGGDDNSGAYDGVYHSYVSVIYPLDDQHPTISDLAIVWYHNFSGRDSNQRMTIHRYRPGKGYDFSNLPYERCTHDTNYRMLDM